MLDEKHISRTLVKPTITKDTLDKLHPNCAAQGIYSWFLCKHYSIRHFLLWASCRQAQPGGEEARGVTAVTFPSLPITITLPFVTASTLNFLAIDYTVGNVPKAFHRWVRACHCCSRKGRQLSFLRVDGGGVTSTRAPEDHPCSKSSQESLIQHCTDVPPASINPPHLCQLLASHGVTKNTWKFSRKDCSNLRVQQFLSIFVFQNMALFLTEWDFASISPFVYFTCIFLLKLLFRSLLQCLSHVTADYFCLREIHSHKAQLSSYYISSLKKKA